jgi:hypothetical protein
MNNIKRYSLVVLLIGLAPLTAFIVSVALTRKARGVAEKYLNLVMPLQIGTPYSVVATQLHNAGFHTIISGDCHRECTVNVHVDDKWLYKLHLAPSVGFNGRLDFRNDILAYKFTSMGQDVMVWSASVTEGVPPFSTEGSAESSRLFEDVDLSGDIRKIFVYLSASDFTEYRKKAYAFNVACIGAIKACTADQYLPFHDLKRLSSAAR